MVDSSSTHSTSQKGQKALAALRQGLSIAAACRRAGIDRKTYYNWRKADPDFADAADAAIENGTDALEDALFRRAKKDDTTAAIFLLKARRPEKYRETTNHNITATVTVADLIARAAELAVTSEAE